MLLLAAGVHSAVHNLTIRMKEREILRGIFIYERKNKENNKIIFIQSLILSLNYIFNFVEILGHTSLIIILDTLP